MESHHGFVVDDELILSFTDLDYCIYNEVVRAGSSLKDMRVADLATAAGVSNASVVRFCKKCGYAGFPDLKAAYTRRLLEDTSEQRIPSLNEDLQAIVESNDIKGYEKQVKDAYEVLRWAQIVYIIGFGRSAGLARYAAHLYNSLGIFTLPIVEYPSLFHRSHLPKGSDVAAIVLSQSGTTPMALSVVQDMHACHIPIVSITTRKDSPIARVSDVCISYELSALRSDRAMMLNTCLPAVAALEQIARFIYNAEIAEQV